MGKEVERKFLVRVPSVLEGLNGTYFKQGYVQTQGNVTVRVRVAGEKAYLTLKGATNGLSRSEFEYEVPKEDAVRMMSEFCSEPMIEKDRFLIRHEGVLWEVDQFRGQNAGLIVAEVELRDEEQEVSLPSWVGEEVSQDARYFNSNLAKHPFKEWQS